MGERLDLTPLFLQSRLNASNSVGGFFTVDMSGQGLYLSDHCSKASVSSSTGSSELGKEYPRYDQSRKREAPKDPR